MTTMAVPATLPVHSGTSAVSAKLFRTDPFFSSPADSPRLSNSLNATLQSGAATNECKIVEVHGVKVASFNVDGHELICLPQVFDLFLKHLVGGLHTVYTKLKRLDINPVVCTVEQVRVLRGLGAIQPGVNRCKLISRKDFEALYNDCTSASSRPGRPPKRSYRAGVQESPRILHQRANSFLSPALLSATGLTTAAMAEALKIQKMKMMMNLHNTHNGSEFDSDELNSNTGTVCSALSWEREKHPSPASEKTQHSLNNSELSSLQHTHLLANRLDLPFMMMPHPLLPVGLPPASVAMAMNQMNHLNTIANMVASAQMYSPVSRPTSAIKQECFEESPSVTPSVDGTVPQKTEPSPQQTSSLPSSPTQPYTLSPQKTAYDVHDEQRETDSTLHMNRLSNDRVEQNALIPTIFEKVPTQSLSSGFPASLLFTDGLSSVEMLLTNVQGLLKVALENARVQEKQLQQERRELKMELYREREMRECLERQLTSELHSRATIQRRLKKEKKAKRRLQEALEYESKRRGQIEQALQQATTSDSLTHDPMSLDMETEQCRSPEDNCLLQESRTYTNNPIMY
ncbi:dachshund homolog 2-like isoform X2 [Sinocyclocheilus anshuiensis]|uniref:Dachshund homolog 2-like n=1 Tax=Sinocyclocheilus anshuiensis TaxID=1608454 RepID=A0A671RZ89_9TELE|nr:PREDICTED: dachshund homolog 2-like isoform X2 [Sinocyclocheilus anshuiensis]